MTERGMIFNAEMVRSLLDGMKTQTRRIVKGTDGAVKFCKEWDINGEEIFVVLGEKDRTGMNPVLGAISCPFGAVGDRIWVRETWARYNIDQNSHDIAYRATTPEDWPEDGRWRPSIHMPRWASRILLEITDVRVERLNAISEEDATAEGVPPAGGLLPDYPGTFLTPKGDFATAKVAFQRLWESIYGEESWKANGWVWVISFKRVEGGAA